MHSPIEPGLIVRDPHRALQQLRRQWHGTRERWVFGYASLIWRPEFDAAEHRPALVHGWHRALRMRSRVNRGTPQQPGLVFALLPGGACPTPSCCTCCATRRGATAARWTTWPAPPRRCATRACATARSNACWSSRAATG